VTCGARVARPRTLAAHHHELIVQSHIRAGLGSHASAMKHIRKLFSRSTARDDTASAGPSNAAQRHEGATLLPRRLSRDGGPRPRTSIEPAGGPDSVEVLRHTRSPVTSTGVSLVRHRPVVDERHEPAPMLLRGTPASGEHGDLGAQPLPRPQLPPLITPSDQFVDDVIDALGSLPTNVLDWDQDQEGFATRWLMRMVNHHAGMSPQPRRRADALIRTHLDRLLMAVDHTASAAQKDVLANAVLQSATDPTVHFDRKTLHVGLLFVARDHFGDLIGTLDADGRAPALLRKHAVPLLRAYRGELARLQAANIQPTTPQWDHMVLPLLVEAQNAATPGLELKLFTMRRLVEHVAQQQDRASESIGILDFGAWSALGRGHTATVHVSTSPDRHPRVTILDSYGSPAAAATPLFNNLPPGSHIVPVFLRTLKAQECVISAVSNAKKTNDHRAAVAALFGETDGSPIGSVVLHKTVFGPEVLPLAFFKHSQQRSTLKLLAETSARSGLHDARNDRVNKDNKTIFERWDVHQVQRRDPKDWSEWATYSASIEAKRMTFIDQALRHFGERAV
jgi:hypothetical protein